MILQIVFWGLSGALFFTSALVVVSAIDFLSTVAKYFILKRKALTEKNTLV